MLHDIFYWLHVPILLWPITIVLCAAIGISAANFAIYRKTEPASKNIVVHISLYLGAAVVGFVCIVVFILAGAGCC